MAVIKINDIEFEFDPLDAECAEKVETAIPTAQTKLIKISEATDFKMSDLIRQTCTAIFECFNEVLGEGADKKIFGESCNMRNAIDAFGQFASQINAEASAQAVENTFAKYMPNREQRRAAKK